MAASPDGRLLVLHSSSGQVFPVAPGGNGSGAPIALGVKPYRLAVAPDGRLVALAGHRTLKVFDAAGRPLHELALPAMADAGEASDVAIDAAGRILVADYDARAGLAVAPGGGGAVLLPFAARQP